MITFDRLSTDHISFIHEWFNKAHVQQFYSLRTWTKEEVEKKLEPYITQKEPVQGFIARVENAPIAYVQYYQVDQYPWPNQGLENDVVQASAGLDLFIGEEEFLGKGWGPKVVNAFLDEFVWPDFQYCVVDPDIRNEASIRSFEKCGFKKHKVIPSESALEEKVELQLMIKNCGEERKPTTTTTTHMKM